MKYPKNVLKNFSKKINCPETMLIAGNGQLIKIRMIMELGITVSKMFEHLDLYMSYITVISQG